MKKRFLAIFICLGIILGMTPISALAAENDMDLLSADYLNQVYYQMADSAAPNTIASDELSVSHAEYLYDFNDQPIAILYQFAPKGYAIYDYVASVVLEYSKDNDHPFYTDPAERYYYNGVFGYYAATANGFVNLATGMVETPDSNNFGRANFYPNPDEAASDLQTRAASEGPVYLDNTTRFYNCNTTSNFSYFYPDFSESQLANIPGVCGSVACAIMVAYYDDHESSLAGSGDFATDWKKTGGSTSNNTYGRDLVKEFVSLIEPSGNGSIFLNPGMSTYLSNHGISGGCSLGLLTVYQQTKNAIGDGSGVPIIIGTSNHYCVGIGYKNISGKQIYVNNGHGGTSWIDASTVVSTWTMYIN